MKMPDVPLKMSLGKRKRKILQLVGLLDQEQFNFLMK